MMLVSFFGSKAAAMKSPEREVHMLDALDAVDFIISGSLQGIAELLGQNDPHAKLCEPVASGTNPSERVGLRRLLLGLRQQA
jgi:hypothetical protein